MERYGERTFAIASDRLEMQETKPKASEPPHKGGPDVSSKVATGRAGYLMLCSSNDNLLGDSDGVNSEITDTPVARVDGNSAELDGPRSSSPGRGLLRLGRQFLKFFRRHRPPRIRGVRRWFSRGDLVEDACYPSKLQEEAVVRTAHVEASVYGDEEPSCCFASASDARPRPNSRLVSALDIEGIHRFHPPSDYDAGVRETQGSPRAVGEGASVGRLQLQVSSRDRFAYHQELSTDGERTFVRTAPDTDALSTSMSEDPPAVPSRQAVPISRIRMAAQRNQTSVTSSHDQTVDTRSSPGSAMKPSLHSQTRSRQDPLNYRELVWHGWYWGSLKREEAAEKLRSQPVGTFLIRDCSDERHLFAVSFVGPYHQVKHSLVAHSRGSWSFYSDMTRSEPSVVLLVERSMHRASLGIPTLVWDSGVTFLTKPLSRFTAVKSLQHHCRFVIRLSCRIDLIPELPLPSGLKEYLKQDIM